MISTLFKTLIYSISLLPFFFFFFLATDLVDLLKGALQFLPYLPVILGLGVNIYVYFFCFHVTGSLSVTFCANNWNRVGFNIPETHSKPEAGLGQSSTLALS